MRRWAILIAAIAIGSCTPAPLAPARQYNPTMTRDAYGVPSVHGRDDQEAAYGIGYAHAQDNFATVQVAVLAVNLFIPVRETPTPSNPIDVSIFANPALYLRIGVGLVFPIILGVLSYKTTQMKAMQSATGLLYIAMGAVFCGEVLAKGLLFLTGKPL